MEIFRLFGSVFINDKDAMDKMKKVESRAGDTQKKMNQMGKSFTTVGKTMTTFVSGPIAALGAGLVGLATKTGEYADRILDLNAITGMSTDAIQRWQNVAKQAGTPVEAITNASQKLTKTLFSLEKGTGKSSQALQRLGISFDELNVMDADARMETLIQRLQEIDDPMERARIGTELFGGSWQEIAPVVALGAEGIEKAKNAINPLSEESLNAANDFRMAMDDLKAQFSMLGMEIGAKVAPMLLEFVPIIKEQIVPAIKEFADRIAGLIEWFFNLNPVAQKIILVLGVMAAAAGPVLLFLGQMITTVAALIPIIKSLSATMTLLAANPVGLTIMAIVAAVAALIAIGILVVKNWDTIKDAAKKTWDFIYQAVKKPINMIIGLINKFIEANETMINSFATAINKIPSIKVPDWIPVMGGKEFGIPQIPTVKLPRIPALAQGGDIMQGGRVLVGEAGPEFLDLPRGARVTPLDQQGVVININNAKLFNEQDAEKLGHLITRYLKIKGVVPR
jgi:hypothetical protein